MRTLTDVSKLQQATTELNTSVAAVRAESKEQMHQVADEVRGMNGDLEKISDSVNDVTSRVESTSVKVGKVHETVKNTDPSPAHLKVPEQVRSA